MTTRAAAARRRLDGPVAERLSAAAARLRERVARRTTKPSRELDITRLLAESPQAVPRLPDPDDDQMPRFAAASLALHATLLLVVLVAALWHRDEAPSAPHEIAVELVQAPPKQSEPKQAEQKKAEQKPPESKPPEPKRPEPKQKQPQHRSAKAARRAPQPPPQQQQQQMADKSPSMPAIALPGASADPNADAVSYSQLVLSKLAKAKKEGRYMGVPGYAGVRFHIADDGGVDNVRLVSSSGDPTLDIEAVAMVKRAAPYPVPPPGGRRDYGITLLFEARP